MNRRGFLQGILAAGMAPAIVRASSLMKLAPSGLLLPPPFTPLELGDGTLELYSAGGTLLAAIGMSKTGGDGLACASGTFSYARLVDEDGLHLPVDLTLSHGDLCVGSAITMMPLSLREKWPKPIKVPRERVSLSDYVELACD